MTPTLVTDDRGVSVAVNHVLAIGITTILIVGVLIAAGDTLQSERSASVDQELQIVGEKLAAQVEEVDRLSRNGGNVTVTSSYPSTVAGNQYSVAIRKGSSCEGGGTCLYVGVDGGTESVTVPLNNQSRVSVSHVGSGTMRISAESTTTTTAGGSVSVDREVTESVGVVEGASETEGPTVEVDVGNQQPAARLSTSPDKPTRGDIVIFDASESVDADGTIETYRWNISGEVTNTSQPVFANRLENAGRYNVSVTVVDDNGGNDTVRIQFRVAGLTYLDDVETVNGGDGLEFTVRNDHDEDVFVEEFYLDPRDEAVDVLDGYSVGGEDEFSELPIVEDGVLEELENEETIGSGSTATVEFNEFDIAGTGDASNRIFDVSFRYRYGDTNDGPFNVSRFTLRPGGPTADAGPYELFEGSTIVRTASATDTDGSGDVEYRWRIVHDPTDAVEFGSGGDETSYRTTGTVTFDASDVSIDDNVRAVVELTTRDDEDVQNTTRFFLTVKDTAGNSPPSAAFTSTDDGGTQVSFDASGSSDSDGSVVTYRWDFDNDGTIDETTSSATTSYTYGSDGTKTVRLVAEDDDGATGAATQNIVVVNEGDPQPSVTASPAQPDVGETVTFDGSGSTDPQGDSLVYEWDLDDDGSFDDATGPTASASYATAGPKVVSLKLTDADGNTNTTSVSVDVRAQFRVIDDFENGDLDANANWSRYDASTSRVYVNDDLTAANSPTHGLTIGDVGGDGGGIESRTIDTSGVSSVKVTVWYKEGAGGAYDQPDPGESLLIRYRTSSGSWTTAKEIDPTGTTVYDDVNLTLSAADATHPDFRVRVVQEGVTAEDAFHVDDICIGSPGTDCGVNLAPDAQATASTSEPAQGESVTFDAASSTDPDGDSLVYEWDLDDDGSFDDAIGVNTTQSFATAGTKEVGLKVTDTAGNSDTTTVAVTVQGTFRIRDDFESGPTSNWSVTNAPSSEVFIEGDSAIANSGSNAVHIGDVGDDGGMISKTINTKVASTVTVELAVKEGGNGEDTPEPGGDEDLVVELRDSNGNWIERDRVAATGSEQPYTTVSFTLDEASSPDLFHQNFAVRIVQVDTSYTDAWHVDDVCVTGGGIGCSGGGGGGGGGGSVSSGTTWATAADWGAATTESGVVHYGAGDRSDGAVELGYKTYDINGNGLQTHYIMDTDNPVDAASIPDVSGTTGGGSHDADTVDRVAGTSGLWGTGGFDFGGPNEGFSFADGDADGYLNGLSEYTISVWVKADSTGTNRGIVYGDDPSGSDDRIGFRYDASGVNTGRTNTIKAGTTVDGTEVNAEIDQDGVQTTDWQHVVVTWESGEGHEIYVDGQQQTTGSNGNSDESGTVSDVEKLVVGKGTKDSGNAGWDGSMDEFRLYDQALSESEVQDLYDTGTTGTLTTDWRTASSPIQQNKVQLDYNVTIPDGNTVTVTVQVDEDGDGSADRSAQLTLDDSDSGDGTVSVPNLGGGQHDTFRLTFELNSDDVTETPTINGVTVEKQ